MDHSKSRKALTICCIIGSVLMALGYLLATASATLAVGLGIAFAGFAVVIIGVILASVYMRCPHCEGPLYYKGAPKPKFCPHCGKPIEW